MKAFLVNVLWGLALKVVHMLMDWWNNKQAQKKIVEGVNDDVDKILESETREEQREALKKLVENARNRMRS